MKKIDAAVSHLRTFFGKRKAKIGLVLGSGLGRFADYLEGGGCVPYSEIPSFCLPGVNGHSGRLFWGRVGGVEVVVLQGRIHLYEGHSPQDVVLPVRVCGMLGIKYVFLTNAAGGIHKDFSPGDLVMLSDHINLTGTSPLEGANLEAWGPRFLDMTEAYSGFMGQAMMEAAGEMNYSLRSGVYAGVRGPQYETPAEVNMLHRMGADMVGMSTVLECLAARHMGIQVGGISCITNKASRKGAAALDHGEVVVQVQEVEEIFATLLQKSIVKVNQLCLS